MKPKFHNLAYLLIFLAIAATAAGSGCGSGTAISEMDPVSPDRANVDKGELVVNEYLKRDKARFRKTRVRLTVEPTEAKKKVYVLETWRRQSNEETRSLTRIIEPKEDSGVATLTIEKKRVPTVNVNYFASRNQFRESGTSKIFFGGLTSQELLGEWNKYDSRLIKEIVVNGKKAFKVESELKEGAKSVIAKIMTEFDRESFLPMKLSLFNSDGREIRTYEVIRVQTIDGRKIATKTQIRNHVYQSDILIEVMEMTFPKSIPDDVFEREYLKRIASPK